MKSKKVISLIIIGGIIFIFIFFLSDKMFEQVDAGEIAVFQDPIDGELHIYTQAGLKWQNFGKATHYQKEEQYWFSSDAAEGSPDDESIRIRFNDGGSATISGSIRWIMPMDEKHLIELHSVYGSQEVIEHELIRTVITKAIYMTGPLLTSKESYAERRPDLISFIDDQARHGVYKTITYEEKTIDPISFQEKTVRRVDILKDTISGVILRQEESPLDKHGISIYNLSLNKMHYSEAILEQIEAQRKAIMDIETSIAEAKKAEQNAIKAEQEGKANAATAKWEQEVLKAKAVTEAEQKKEVARLTMEAADYYKKEQILIGEGDAKRKQLVMQADGALEQKLKTYENVNRMYATAIQNYQGNWVPAMIMGGTGGTSTNGANALVDLLMAKTARELSLDLGMKK